MSAHASRPNGGISLGELTIELAGIKALVLARVEAIRELVDERDRLYKERDDARRTAVDAALTAVKDQTKANFDASEKAIVKAEDAQRDYNVRSNEFRGQLDDQAKTLMARLEALGMFRALEDKIAAQDAGFTKTIDELKGEITKLRESQASGAGKSAGSSAMWALVVGGVFLLLALLGAGLSLASFLRQ